MSSGREHREKTKKVWNEEDERIRREDRELQFEMFRVSLQHDSIISFFTMMIAVSVSWIVATMTIITVPEVPSEIRASIVTSGLVMLVVFMSLSIVFIALSMWFVQTWQVNRLRKRYVSKNPQ